MGLGHFNSKFLHDDEPMKYNLPRLFVLHQGADSGQLQQHVVNGKLPNAEDVKRWYQLLTGKGEDEMQKDIKATCR